MSKTLIGTALATAFASALGVAAIAAEQYQPIPPGYGYNDPNEVAKLQAAVKAGGPAGRKVVREHGWKLWAGIMQPSNSGSAPLWYTWPNTFAAFQPDQLAADASGAGRGRDQSRIQFNLTVLGGEAPGAVVPVNIKNVPSYPIPGEVKTAYPKATSQCASPANPENICDGAHVLFNGDIMIASESLSQDAYDTIRGQKYYLQSTLNNFDKHVLPLPQTYVVTKHMYWPVPRGQVAAIPVWHRDFNKPNDPSYQGYETWRDFVAVDPSGKYRPGSRVPVEYLYKVFDPKTKKQLGPIKAQNVVVHAMDEFYNHQVTDDEWKSFDEADKAIINAASYWAYNKPFGPGDYLVTIAMHINTKEIPSWALQSVWWSDRPNAGAYAQDRPDLRKLNPKGPWNHYLLVDAYGIPDSKNKDKLPVATNPYIELVTHPVGTDCNNCHNRAGWPTGKGQGKASYQNPDCPDLLARLSPDSACLKSPTLTDFQWIIPDRALK